jgi:hypothetical protein
VILVLILGAALVTQSPGFGNAKSYVGFDRNEYPGDANLAALRATFSFAGYWLNAPHGAAENTWTGKRVRLREEGFGFLVLFNGRLDAALKNADAHEMGRKDAVSAVDAARDEGFPAETVIFLDQEEGGRLLPEQKAYVLAWVDGVTAAGFQAGVYGSGIAVADRDGRVSAVEDIRESSAGRKITYWVANDVCPPSPGCSVPKRTPAVTEGGVPFAAVWQYAQSPKRKGMTKGCPKNYAPDGNCYAPGLEKKQLFVDLDVAMREDPSNGR